MGICVDLDSHDELSIKFSKMKEECLRLYRKVEMKGSMISKNHLREGVSVEDVGMRIADIITEFDLKIWITATRGDPGISTKLFVPSNRSKGVLPKDIARELLLERISGYTGLVDNNGKYLMIWDLSDTQELSDFSNLIENYVNPYNGKKTCPSIIPNILGGLSHEWPELQLCDLIANFSLNHLADGYFDDCDKMKSRVFKKHIYPLLMKGENGIDGIGWKVYF